ncbi:hypothetical protein MPTK1_7g13430 [Marchantia polymorpha subsp. ruderalis]|uniref:Uncharacterized protein n=2 Tax=Marchantia polymorpha TaxID=3197 RepID=A0AAF6BZ60_MARPO|nr:hypothetical protein MARPO_0009s0029 [Marchantia polymorpha]BBN17294.1 hypothetical protein Mp_7g13430 [Marchantia polymorpha subsp. ruderalis]|eukprot:PTQ46899.1 hypothetical protein MARPO_0009s0029 [Marchantia polymorpha]
MVCCPREAGSKTSVRACGFLLPRDCSAEGMEQTQKGAGSPGPIMNDPWPGESRLCPAAGERSRSTAPPPGFMSRAIKQKQTPSRRREARTPTRAATGRRGN